MIAQEETVVYNLESDANAVSHELLITAAIGEDGGDVQLAPSFLRRLAEDLKGLQARVSDLTRYHNPDEIHLISSVLERTAQRCYAVAELHYRLQDEDFFQRKSRMHIAMQSGVFPTPQDAVSEAGAR
jgi:hypothetical protein